MMNEGQFIALRGLGQETNSLLMQLLEAQNKTNELITQLTAIPASVMNSEPEKAASKPMTVTRDMGNLGPISAETGEPVKPKAAPKKGKPGVKPDVNWNS